MSKGINVRRLLANRYFYIGGESGITSVFKYRLRPKYVKYATEGYYYSRYDYTVPKYVLYDRPHESYSKNYRKLYPLYYK
ncbi:hypothetical protein N7516_008155 [Penicillium verrucosum]|uniref:uncharacterized protein n=1 Tax=Penicillium verrucosum TaxID=60171 RepID=UPI0025457BC5|nr:uncharacterized protein N7516_008155 [Penicillium verrucosum]KAJ5926382.1 hypothetical protein N7516_008155 [Penicillium verrucosum]